jgi:hypothetical protein
MVTMPSRRWGIGSGAGRNSDSEEAPTELRSRNTRTFHKSRPIVPCAQCGEALFAPEWSEYLDDRRVRHLWSCDSCSYEFETEVCYPEPGVRAA